MSWNFQWVPFYPLQKGQTVVPTIVLSKKSWVVAMSECRCKDTVSCRPLCTKMSTWGLGEARVAGLRGLRTSAPVPRWPRPGPGSARFRSTARTPRASFGAQRVRLACPAVWQLRPLGQSHALPRLFAESPAGRRGATAGDGLSAPSACRHSPPGSRGPSAAVPGGEDAFPGLASRPPAWGRSAEASGRREAGRGPRGAWTRPALERPQVNEARAGGRAPLRAGLSPAARAPGAAFSAGCHSGVGGMAHSKAPRGGPASALQ